MIRPVSFFVALLSATSAWATGERIQVVGPANHVAQLKETLCISMDCVGKGQAAQASVIATPVKDQLEVKVVGFDGKVRHIEKIAVNAEGRVSSFDLVSATAQLLNAIENPNLRVEEPKKKDSKKLAKAQAKKKHQQLANKKKSRRSAQLASR